MDLGCHVLADGQQVWLRPIQREDATALVEAFSELSAESKYLRFLTGAPLLNEQAVRYLTDVDGENHVAIVAVAGAPSGAGSHGVGVARFIRLVDEPDAAEAAVTVVDRYQRKGLGTLLLCALRDEARLRGVRVLRATALPSNLAVRKFVEAARGSMRVDAAGSVIVEVPL